MDSFYNSSDPVYVMKQKLDDLITSVRKEKYNIILSFINKLFNKTHKSLRDVKNIKYTDMSHEALNILSDFQKKFKDKLKIVINVDDLEDEDLTEEYIFNLIKSMVKSIEYSLIRTEKNKKNIYTIIDKPSKSTRQKKDDNEHSND